MSVGSNEIVSPTHPYIFGAGGYFFANDPVYFGLAWKPADRAEARFDLVDRMPRVAEGYRLKTHGPQAPGPALVLSFENPGTLVSPAQLEAGEDWGFWPTSMVVPGPGCYALQIDTESSSDIVVFEAT